MTTKMITDIVVTVATFDEKGNLIRTNSLDWNTEESEDAALSQSQIQDAVASLCEFFEDITISTPIKPSTKDKDQGKDKESKTE